VQAMEKAGIGRPSTYASIIATVIDRGYVRKVQNALIPSFTGFAVVQLLENHFEQLVDLNFTSKMEASLDEIAEGDREWLPYLKEFYLGKNGLLEQVKEKERKIKPEASRTVQLHNLDGVEVKIGRFGAYLIQKDPAAGDKVAEKKADKRGKAEDRDEVHASIPEDIAPADLSPEQIHELLEIQKKGPQPIGQHPETKEFIYCLTGRYGPYVQLGEVSELNPKPKRASVPKGVDPRAVTIPEAVKWLSLPRTLGMHPADGKPVVVNNGRFGPYVVHEGNFRSLKKEDDVYTVALPRALELLAQEKKGRGGASLIREVGPHPEDQKPIGLYEGKYGPYVKHGSKNASLRKDQDPAKLTLEEAIALLNERAGKSGGKGGKKGKAAAATADDADLEAAGAAGVAEDAEAPKAPKGAKAKAPAKGAGAKPKKK
jgi:DNA topoisomerase-1